MIFGRFSYLEKIVAGPMWPDLRIFDCFSKILLVTLLSTADSRDDLAKNFETKICFFNNQLKNGTARLETGATQHQSTVDYFAISCALRAIKE